MTAKVRTRCRQNINLPLEVLLHRLNPVLRGWTAHFRPGVSGASPSATSAPSPGARSSGGYAANTPGSTGRSSGAASAPEDGGPPTARWSCSTPARCGRPATATGARRSPAMAEHRMSTTTRAPCGTCGEPDASTRRTSGSEGGPGKRAGGDTGTAPRVDPYHVNIRLEEHKLCLLVMIGVRADGRKELVALADGYRESTESWADLLRDCARRGMRAPVLAVGDGALGFWGALREVFPTTREQRCWFHYADLRIMPMRRPSMLVTGSARAGEVGIIRAFRARRGACLVVGSGLTGCLVVGFLRSLSPSVSGGRGGRSGWSRRVGFQKSA